MAKLTAREKELLTEVLKNMEELYNRMEADEVISGQEKWRAHAVRGDLMSFAERYLSDEELYEVCEEGYGNYLK